VKYDSTMGLLVSGMDRYKAWQCFSHESESDTLVGPVRYPLARIMRQTEERGRVDLVDSTMNYS